MKKKMRDLIIAVLLLQAVNLFSDVYYPVQADWSYEESTRTITYKEKTYRSKSFSKNENDEYEIIFPVIFQESLFDDWYAQDIIINSYTSELVDDSLGLTYYQTYTDTSLTHIHPDSKPVRIGSRGTKRKGNFSILEINPYYVRNDSLFFITEIDYTLTDYIINPFIKRKDDLKKIDMVIVTDSHFSDNYERFRDFKIKQGFITEIKTVEEIYTEYTGDSEVEKIRNFIKDKYISNDLKYVLIGGGYKTVPLGTGLPYVSSDTSTIFTDSFYSKLDGITDGDGDGVSYEISDRADAYDDVYVGRFPANTEEETDAVIDKTIEYYSSARNYRTGFNTSLFLLGMDVFDTGDGRRWCNNVKTEFSALFVKDSLYENVSPDFGKDGIFDRLDAGYNFMYSQSHGDYHVLRQTDYDFKIWSDEIMGLGTVSGLYFIDACKPGYFGGDSFSHKAMTNPNGGCVTYIGSGGQEFPAASSNFNAYFFRQMFKRKSYGESLSDAGIVFGNIVANGVGHYLTHAYGLQGDPSGLPFLREPKSINISSAGVINKGSGSVSITLSSVPNDTVFVALTEKERIINKLKIKKQTFNLPYENITEDSVFINYFSQECFLKSYGYKTGRPTDISISLDSIGINENNSSGIAEHGEDFGISFEIGTTSNPGGVDSLDAVIVSAGHGWISVLQDSLRFAVPPPGERSSVTAFDLNFASPDSVVSDSSAVILMEIRKKDGTKLSDHEIFLPLSVPYLRLSSFSIKSDTLSPVFVNSSKGVIDRAKIELLDNLIPSGQVVLHNIPGRTSVSDSVSFAADPLRSYSFRITVNDDKVYYSDVFDFGTQTGQAVLYADHSPGRINLEWTYSYPEVGGVNVYASSDSSFTDADRKNTDKISGKTFSFQNNGFDPVYVAVGFCDTSGYEFAYSDTVKISTFPLYTGSTFKIAPFELYNPVYYDGKLISNSRNSSIAGISSDGTLINGTGLLHEADVNGFSLTQQQGFAIGDINSDGHDEMVYYNYNFGDSVLVKAVDLQTGELVSKIKIYGFIMENAPVLANADYDSDLEIFISVFNGNIGGTPAKGSYVYMLDISSGQLSVAPGFPVYSAYSSYNVHSPSVLDLDGDGEKELIFNCGTRLIVYSLDPPALLTEYTMPKSVQTSLSFCDTDQNGQTEIYALTESYGTYAKMFGFTFDGTSLIQIPALSGGKNLDMKTYNFSDLTPPVCFADIDGNGTIELISVTASKIYIMNTDYTSFSNYPVALDTRLTANDLAAPSLADFNGDGYLDVLFLDQNSRVWCYSGSTGKILEGFPVLIEDLNRPGVNSLAVADLDSDGDLEFAAGADDGVMVVYDYPLQTSSRPVYDKYRADLYNSGYFNPLAPAAPEGLALSVTGSDVTLSWNASAGASSYKVYSSAEPYGSFVYEGETTDTQFTIYSAPESRKFFFVKAVR